MPTNQHVLPWWYKEQVAYKSLCVNRARYINEQFLGGKKPIHYNDIQQPRKGDLVALLSHSLALWLAHSKKVLLLFVTWFHLHLRVEVDIVAWLVMFQTFSVSFCTHGFLWQMTAKSLFCISFSDVRTNVTVNGMGVVDGQSRRKRKGHEMYKMTLMAPIILHYAKGFFRPFFRRGRKNGGRKKNHRRVGVHLG